MSVKSGFQKITIHEDIVFAANGPNIHSFSLEGYKHIASWRYPHPWLAPKETVEKADAAAEEDTGITAAAEVSEITAAGKIEPESVEDGPPSKRRRVETEPELEAGKDGVIAGEMLGVNVQDQAMDDGEGEAAGVKEGKSKGQNGKKRGNGKNYGLGFGKQKEILDIPMFQCVAITTDGKYLVGAIGTTKTIWTFEHDGKGGLTELSQRPMPKRPCSIVITSDNKTILSADKFGDVYALPVIPGEPLSADVTPSLSRSATPSAATPKYQANPLTVHTRRNLQALEHQKKQAEKGQTDKPTTTAPDFEHRLVLGHVSMLTDIILATYEGKEYIITADRDEHIRVSRGLPQSHVIENYCLGHKEFVSALHVPKSHPHILISGGGDPELYVWDWTKGELLQKIRVGHGDEQPSLPLAVSGIASFDSEDGQGATVAVVCENSSTAYYYRLSHADHRLESVSHAILDGNAFDIVSSDKRGRFIISTDPNLAAESKNDGEPSKSQGRLLSASVSGSPNYLINILGPAASTTGSGFDNVVELVDDVPEGRLEDLHKALYTIEPLRKVGYERKDGAGEDEDGAEGGDGSEAVTEQDQA